ncbi:hypothetical protein OsI_36743 [Oryza sativa Indica Group]|uniref:Uncharacterized protein n=1 Tax=Oryza sativa subsp. indica TaxID=39946 RepID=B8BLF1_ORYSI|nr:hypothetical protein OsI_36743 [Oryza sativa Indica Group]
MANLSFESFFELLGLRVKVVVEVVADGDVHGLISHYKFRTGASEVWRGWLGGLASEAKQIQLGEAAVACGYDKWAAAAARLPAK